MGVCAEDRGEEGVRAEGGDTRSVYGLLLSWRWTLCLRSRGDARNTEERVRKDGVYGTSSWQREGKMISDGGRWLGDAVWIEKHFGDDRIGLGAGEEAQPRRDEAEYYISRTWNNLRHSCRLTSSASASTFTN